MIALFKKVIKDCLTGRDGESYDPARIYGAMAVNIFFVLAVVAVVYHKQPWDAQAYGIGFGALLAGFGLGVQLKSNTEPGQGTPPTPSTNVKSDEA